MVSIGLLLYEGYHITAIIKNDLKKETLQIIYLFSRYNKKEHSKALFISCYHCVKSVHVQSYSGLHFHSFKLSIERYKTSLCIQSECGKIRTRTTPNMDTIYTVYIIVKKVSSSFRKKFLHQKIYYNIALTSI